MRIVRRLKRKVIVASRTEMAAGSWMRDRPAADYRRSSSRRRRLAEMGDMGMSVQDKVNAATGDRSRKVRAVNQRLAPRNDAVIDRMMQHENRKPRCLDRRAQFSLDCPQLGAAERARRQSGRRRRGGIRNDQTHIFSTERNDEGEIRRSAWRTRNGIVAAHADHLGAEKPQRGIPIHRYICVMIARRDDKGQGAERLRQPNPRCFEFRGKREVDDISG